MNDKISVIIPVYNGEKTIKFTIESVLNQSYANLEIIVVDDGSIDSTLKLVESIHDSRIKLFSYQNSGACVARNRGLSKALGKYIAFLDADDLWTFDKLEYQWKVLQENPHTSVAYSWTDYINADGEVIRAGRHITANGDIYSKLAVCNFLENGSNPLISYDALKATGGFDESLTASQDWDMWLRLAAEYEFVCVERVQILYRVSINSISSNLQRQEAASLKVIESAFNHQKMQGLSHIKQSSLAHLYKYLTFKSLDLPLRLQRKRVSTRFLWNCIKYDFSILQQKRVILVALIKITFPRLYLYFKALLHINS
jgi:glycosyltransferase involved in cell wall biosynthesis